MCIRVSGLRDALAYQSQTGSRRQERRKPAGHGVGSILETNRAAGQFEVTTNNQIEVFPNGENFYEAELASLRQAQRSINIEAYIFHRGQVTRRLLRH
jgi:phosphatidylserine/phosphatidylglycerophosphate/cardiolipin synthase-like enzyme